MPFLLLAGALSGCAGGGRALPPAPSAERSALGVPPPPPTMQAPRRRDFLTTVPKDPSSAALSAHTPVAQTPHPSFFNGEVALSNGVYYLQLANGNLVGYYSYLPDSNYIYHFDAGYEYLIDANDGRGGVYMYDFASGHWWYTGAQYPFPYIYDFTLSAVLYYYPDSAQPQHYTTAPRYFYNFATSQIITIPSALPAPAVGYLGPASAGSLAGVMNNVSSGVTLVGISDAVVSGGPTTTVPTGNVTVNFGATVLSAGRAPQAVAAVDGPLGATELPVEGPAAFRALKQRLVPTSGPPSENVRRVHSLGTSVGSSNLFWVSTGAIGTNGTSETQRPATLRAVTTHGYIWVDDTLAATVNDSTVQAIANDFENAYDSDTTHYGTATYTSTSLGMIGANGRPGAYTACDSTGAPTGGGVPFYILPTDNKVVVFVVDVLGLGTGVGGYFSSTSYYYQTALNCLIGHGYTALTVPHSNEAPLIVVGYNSPSGSSFETGEDLVRGTSHEFQHQINFVHHAILTNGDPEEPWINEGMSMLAQDFAVNKMFPSVPFDVADSGARARQYLAAPETFSLTSFTSLTGGTQHYNCSGCYGFSYLFQRYLYDRFGGDAYLKKMLNGQAGIANIQQATGADPAQTIPDFAVAIAASGTGATSDPRFGFTGITLRGVYTDQFARTSSFVGPATLPLATGTSPHMLGSFFYLNGDATAAGKTISVKDTTGSFNLRAGVVQR